MKTLYTYIVGFALSIVLTLVAFLFVEQFLLPRGVLVATLVTLAVVQLIAQLVCFLHLGKEKKPRWNLAALVFALLIVAILVGGTLWIMQNLSHGQMQEPLDIFTEENIFPTHSD